MGKMLFTDNAESTLAAATVGASSTSITLADSSDFPAVTTASGDYFYARIGTDSSNEVVRIKNNDAGTEVLTLYGSDVVASTWPIGTSVQLVNNTDTMEDFDQKFENVTSVSSSTNVTTFNLELGHFFTTTMTEATTFTPSNVPTSAASWFQVVVTQDASSAYAITHPATDLWAGGTAATDPAVSEVDVFRYSTVDGGTNWYCEQLIDAAS